LVIKEAAERTPPNRRIGKKRRERGIPEALKAMISFEEANFPTDIRHPTKEEKGAENATMEGREYRISRATSMIGTFFDRISSARRRS
jgi:hypothetical protein